MSESKLQNVLFFCNIVFKFYIDINDLIHTVKVNKSTLVKAVRV